VNSRGIALPTALIVLAILSPLVVAFVGMMGNEPVIAGNHLLGTQALALAESGVERAIWALGPASGPHPGGPGVHPLFTPARAAATAPWDGTALLSVTPAGGLTVPGAFTVRLVPGARANEVDVTSTGRLPSPAGPRATRIIQTTVVSLANRFDVPGAVNVNGELGIGGNASLRASGDACQRPGTPATGSYSAGDSQVHGLASICAGADCSDAGSTCVSPSCTQRATDATRVFEGLRLGRDELDVLRSMARAGGTYWGPGQVGATPGHHDGRVDLAQLPDGVVFIDTVSGAGPDAGNRADLAHLRVTGGAGNGWLIVLGSLELAGSSRYRGLVYLADDLTAGQGHVVIEGAVIAHNVDPATASALDGSTGGGIAIAYDCAAVAGGGRIPQGFFVKPGSWREGSHS
jgi:hypothetical protein